MRKIKFRPLRVIKKTGKITVASYMQWRSIKAADYNKFTLVIDESYKMLNDADFVYDHLGKQLFFYDFNPNDIIINTDIPDEGYLDFIKDKPYILLDRGDYKKYWCRGLDIDGVPTFSHYTPDYIVSDYTRDITVFEPLTVGMVKMWFGWFLYQLDNSRLQLS